MACRFCVVVVLVFGGMQMHAQSVFDQKIDLSVEGLTIPQVLKKVGETAGIDLAFSPRIFQKKKKLTLHEKQRSLRYLLEKILDGSEVDFKEIEGQIVLFPAPKKTLRKYTLSGYVEDAASGERLIAAAVYCAELGVGTVTNEYGFFSLTLLENIGGVSASYIGYQEVEKEIQLAGNQQITIGLPPSITLAEIIVMPQLERSQLLPAPGNGQSILPDDFQVAPDLGGENDLMRIVQLLPGVQTGADGFGGLHIRGGNADQNLVLLDGVPIYNPDHLMGIFSVFNTKIVKSSRLYRGAIPARYGGRVSSVFDVRTKEGNRKQWSGGGSVGLLAGNVHVGGPFAGGKGSILLTGRTTHTDFMLNQLGRKFFTGDEDLSTNLEFYDVNAKVSFEASERDRIYLGFYLGDDFFSGSLENTFLEEVDEEEVEFESNFDSELEWGNLTTSLRWNHVFHPKLFANTTLTYSRYRFSSEILEKESPEDEELEDGLENFIYERYFSNIQDAAARIDLEHSTEANHYFRFGGGLTQHRIEPESRSFDFENFDGLIPVDSLDFQDFDGDNFSEVLHATEAEVYVEDEFKPGDDWHVNLGLRTSAFFHEEPFFNVEPRLLVNWQASPKTNLKASLTRHAQYLHRLAFNEINLPQDVWVPAYEELPAQTAWQATLGLERQIPSGLDWSLEGFFKKMNNVQVVALQSAFEFEDPEEVLGSGRSYGLEFFIRKMEGKTGGWLSYTLATSERSFTDSIQEIDFMARFDRRHDVKLFLYRRLGKHWQCSANWIYGSPQQQLLTAELELSDPIDTTTEIPAFPYRSSIRSTPYHRLDLALSFHLKKKRSAHRFKISLFNVYNRKNVAFYRRFSTADQEPVSLLSITPGLSYGVEF